MLRSVAETLRRREEPAGSYMLTDLSGSLAISEIPGGTDGKRQKKAAIEIETGLGRNACPWIRLNAKVQQKLPRLLTFYT